MPSATRRRPHVPTFCRAACGLLAVAALAACVRPGRGEDGPAPDPAARAPTASATLIRGARVLDGTGAPARTVAVRIAGDRIAGIGDLEPLSGEAVVEAHGLVLAPGFIDTHSHHDRALLTHPDALGAVSQGITTVVSGVDGSSAHPLTDWFREVEDAGVAVNVASFSGHGTLRERVLGDDYHRAATDEEVAAMARLLRGDLEAGALGLSTGLEYDPGIYATTDEVIALARLAGEAGGRYSSHMRSEDRRLLEAVDETIRIGREADIPVQISHLKLAMKSLWGEAGALLDRLDSARAAGVDVTADVYPYTYWQSTMTVLFPDRDFGDRDAAAFALAELAPPEGMIIARFEPEPSYEGRTLAEVASRRGQSPVDAYMGLIAEARSADADESIIATSMDENDVVALLRWPHTNVASDGGLAGAHPRGFGAFTRVLGPYVRAGRLRLEEAVHKMTGLAAEHVGIHGRGVIREGAFADLVLFDPVTVSDRATPEQPWTVSTGIRRVWVNGRVVYQDGATTSARPGRILRRLAGAGIPSGPTVSPPRPSPRPAGVGAALDDAARAAIDDVFAAYNRTDAPGCAVGVVRDRRLAFAKGYGMANLEHGIALSPGSVFRIGSVSKQFTAAAMVLLEQDGLLSLDDPVRTHLPELPDYGPAFTIRSLLHHTSGVRDYLTLTALAGYRDDDFFTDDDAIRLLARQPATNFEPGTEFLYSNSGYFLLSRIVQRVTGMTLARFAEERLFGPLGMRHTHFHDDHTRIVPDRAIGYAPALDGAGAATERGAGDGAGAPGWRISVTTLPMVGDGGVFTTVEDLALWDRNFDDPVLGGRAFVQAMLRRGVLSSGDTLDYALGLSHGTHRGLRTVAHGGAFVGYRAASLRYPDRHLSVYTLCNRGDAEPSRLSREVGQTLLADHMDQRPEPRRDAPADDGEKVDTLPTPPDALRAFAGDYRSETLDATYRLRVVDGALVLEVGNWLDGPMARVGVDRFRRGPLRIRFIRSEDAVVGMSVDAGRVRGIDFARLE